MKKAATGGLPETGKVPLAATDAAGPVRLDLMLDPVRCRFIAEPGAALNRPMSWKAGAIEECSLTEFLTSMTDCGV
jgi:hypothetical protein